MLKQDPKAIAADVDKENKNPNPKVELEVKDSQSKAESKSIRELIKELKASMAYARKKCMVYKAILAQTADASYIQVFFEDHFGAKNVPQDIQAFVHYCRACEHKLQNTELDIHSLNFRINSSEESKSSHGRIETLLHAELLRYGDQLPHYADQRQNSLEQLYSFLEKQGYMEAVKEAYKKFCNSYGESAKELFKLRHGSDMLSSSVPREFDLTGILPAKAEKAASSLPPLRDRALNSRLRCGRPG